MMKTQQEKLKLEREKVKTPMLEAQATMLKVMNESSNVLLTKMKKEAKILQADMSTMDPLARAWYMIYHYQIGNEVMAAQAAMAAAAVAAPMPTTLVMDRSIMEEPKVMEVPPPITIDNLSMCLA
jgi:hypothetical protein